MDLLQGLISINHLVTVSDQNCLAEGTISVPSLNMASMALNRVTNPLCGSVDRPTRTTTTQGREISVRACMTIQIKACTEAGGVIAKFVFIFCVCVGGWV